MYIYIYMNSLLRRRYVLSMAGTAYTVTIRSEAWEELAKIMPVKVIANT